MLKICGMILVMVILQGCQQNMSDKTNDSYCLLFEPIRYSKNDTAETINQVIKADAVFIKICQPN